MMIINKRLLIILSAIAFLLLIPLIAMQFTDEVNWTLFDFVVAGGLLFFAGLIFDLVFRKTKNVRNRIIISVILLIVFLLVWVELAVGIFGTPFSGT